MTMVMTRMTRAVTMPPWASHCASGGNVGVTFMTMFLHVVGGITSPCVLLGCRLLLRQSLAGLTKEGALMKLSDTNQGRLRIADSLRATLLGLILQSLGDDYLELADGTAPSEQRLDRAVWLTSEEAESGVAAKLDAAIATFEAQLAELGLRGVVHVASDGWLIDERQRIRARLYGEAGEG
jgi:hypothetical protein